MKVEMLRFSRATYEPIAHPDSISNPISSGSYLYPIASVYQVHPLRQLEFLSWRNTCDDICTSYDLCYYKEGLGFLSSSFFLTTYTRIQVIAAGQLPPAIRTNLFKIHSSSPPEG